MLTGSGTLARQSLPHECGFASGGAVQGGFAEPGTGVSRGSVLQGRTLFENLILKRYAGGFGHSTEVPMHIGPIGFG